MTAPIATISVAVNLAVELANALLSVNQVIAQAQANNANTITPEQWQNMIGADDAGLTRLQNLIAAAKALPK